jgi:general secretion pathway protein A
MTDAMEPLEFLGLLCHGLGVSPAGRVATARLELGQALSDETNDGRSWLLVLENAQFASPSDWKEILALIHAMEAGEGFAAILLVGPTALARQLSRREWSAVATRLATHVHLLPLDLDECRELVMQWGEPEALDRGVVESLHRDVGGNPRRLAQVLHKWHGSVEPRLPYSPADRPGQLPHPSLQQPHPQSLSTIGLVPPPAQGPAISSTGMSNAVKVAHVPVPETPPELFPSRPPLRVEEGLVEVGWEGSLEAESSSLEGESETPGPAPRPAEPEVEPGSEEMIEDHYAALQAWNEWAKNRGRTSDLLAADVVPEQSPTQSDQRVSVEDKKPAREAEALAIHGLRAEAQHEHAPYSQLFSRLRQSR